MPEPANTSAARKARPKTEPPTGYDELLQVLADLPVIVRETRRRRGQSLREVADETGVAASTIMRLERGDVGANLGSVVAVLRWSAT